jgi:glucan phosphoethanolaminetransferase (alkaline phosphatase superfamily)
MNHLTLTHNVLRWGVLIFGLYAITKAVLGLVKNQEYTKYHNLSAVLFVAFTHLQILIGLWLYFNRGYLDVLFSGNMGEVMKNSALRFWTIEHFIGMLLSAVLIQICRSKSKKAVTPRMKHKISLRFFVIGLIIIIASIPWPFRAGIGRDLWPF